MITPDNVAQWTVHAVQNAYVPPPELHALGWAVVIYTLGVFVTVLTLGLSDNSPFISYEMSDEAKFVVRALVVLLWPLGLILAPLAVYLGIAYIGRGIADLWDMRPRRKPKTTVPKMRVIK